MSKPTAAEGGFRQITCIEVTCGSCSTKLGDEGNDGIGWHFPNRDDAAKHATEHGWWVTTEGVQCERCAARQACERNGGHHWGSWHEFGNPDDPSEPRRKMRTCQIEECSTNEFELATDAD